MKISNDPPFWPQHGLLLLPPLDPSSRRLLSLTHHLLVCLLFWKCRLCGSLVPGMADWLIGSISTECTDLASEKWNRAGSLTFSQCIQPASPLPPTHGPVPCQRACRDRRTFIGLFFCILQNVNVIFKKNTHRSLCYIYSWSLCSALPAPGTHLYVSCLSIQCFFMQILANSTTNLHIPAFLT